MKSRALLFMLLLSWFPGFLFGQVATPSIDPSAPVWLASAGSWRFGTSLAVGNQYGSQETDVQKVAAHGLGTAGLIVFQPSHVTSEIYSLSGGQRAVWEASSDNLYIEKKSESRFNLSVRGDGRVSVGLGGISRKIDSQNVLRTQKGFGGSFGFRLGDGFYGGLGMDRLTESVVGEEDKIWSDYTGGLSLAYGDPDSSMFRFEVAGKMSPLVAKGDTFAAVHQKKTEQYADLELLWDRWFFSGRGLQTKRFATLSGEIDQQDTELRYGLGYRRLSVSLIFYRILVDTQGATGWYKERSYQATVAIGFL